MSRTDHPRPRNVKGHRVRVAHVRLYGGQTAEQSRCKCGLVGPQRASWAEANNDGRDHYRAVYEAVQS